MFEFYFPLMLFTHACIIYLGPNTLCVLCTHLCVLVCQVVTTCVSHGLGHTMLIESLHSKGIGIIAL